MVAECEKLEYDMTYSIQAEAFNLHFINKHRFFVCPLPLFFLHEEFRNGIKISFEQLDTSSWHLIQAEWNLSRACLHREM